jgi:AAA+ ATPase superfamily predicted ATPase
MKNRITNPFLTGGYIGPEYFCNRQKETEKLLKAISSRRNVTLISLRRMGKTGLLKHVSHHLMQTKNSVSVIYVDLMPTMNGNDMLNAISSALIQIKKEESNFFEKILTVVASLRPKLTYDTLTGQPSVELKVESASDIQYGLDHLLRYISEIKQDLVFMFDEFQQINNYPEKNIEQLLRTIIQSYPSIPFIFSGSSKHMLEPMFLSAGRPFYQSSELMYLDKIEETDYRKFITDMLLSGDKKIDEEALSRILTWTRLHTFYVQYVFNHLYENDNKTINQDMTSRVFYQILAAFEPLYASFRNLIPSHQYKLLQAIAVEDGITQPTSGQFIAKHNLNSASSVTTSMKALAEKELIVPDDTKWLVYDVFFARWLEYHYKR